METTVDAPQLLVGRRTTEHLLIVNLSSPVRGSLIQCKKITLRVRSFTESHWQSYVTVAYKWVRFTSTYYEACPSSTSLSTAPTSTNLQGALPRVGIRARQDPAIIITGTMPPYAAASDACGEDEYSIVCQNCFPISYYISDALDFNTLDATGYVRL